MIRKTIASAALAASMLVTGVAYADVEFKPLEKDPETIVFGFISTESSSNLKAQWQPLIEDMEEALGKDVEAFFAPDYAGIIEGMRFGKVHVGWFGNKSAMEAVDRAGGEVFVQTSKSDGTNGYYSHIITQADNDKLNTLADMLKCDGTLNFKTVRNANHETNLMATANNQVDVAANNSEQLARTQMVKPEITDKVKVIWTSPLIPSDPMVYRKDMSRELKSEIKAFFLGYGRLGNVEEANKVLGGIQDGMGKFMESSNAQLYPIRQLELYKNKLKIENTAELSADEKAARIAEIDMKLAELDILVSYE